MASLKNERWTVKFVKRHGVYLPGEEETFPFAIAEQLVAGGFAERVPEVLPPEPTAAEPAPESAAPVKE